MNKKNKIRTLASSALTALVLATTLNLGTVHASAGQVTRTSGADRYATASQVATKNWTTSENVVLVCGEGYADAVSASALAKKLDAPILLTPAKTLSTDAKQALETLKAKNIYVIGGNASVSQEVRTGLKANYNLIELGGTNRYETNIAVAEKLVALGVDPANTMLVGGEGFSDALSVAPVAASKGQILLLGMNDANYIKPVTNFITKNKSQVTVVGTTNVINADTFTAVGGVNRINGGLDRFDTNLKVLNSFKADLKMDKAYIANASGDGYADALVASALAGKASSPLVLVDKETSTATASAIDYLKSNINSTTDLQVVGGLGVVSENLVGKINAVVPTTDNKLQIATDAVTKAESSKLQADVDTAKTLVNALPDGADKTNLTARINAIVVVPTDTNVAWVINPSYNGLTTTVKGSVDSKKVKAVKALVDGVEMEAGTVILNTDGTFTIDVSNVDLGKIVVIKAFDATGKELNSANVIRGI